MTDKTAADVDDDACVERSLLVSCFVSSHLYTEATPICTRAQYKTKEVLSLCKRVTLDWNVSV